MFSNRHFLDHNSTTPLSNAARAAMIGAMDVVGNPSSVHQDGRTTRAILEGARRALAAMVSTDPENVYWTSGATEANNQIVRDAQERHWPVFVGATEHVSILDAAPNAVQLPVFANGQLDLDKVGALLPPILQDCAKPEPFLVCAMLANNETGVIHPIAALSTMVRERGGFLHVDAVQAAGKINIDSSALGADSLAISAHKIGGPKGVGALIRHNSSMPEPMAIIVGGGQERRRRAGTENVLGIAGFGAAAANVSGFLDEMDNISSLRGWFETEMRAISPDVTIFGEGAERLANTSCFGLTGVSAETAVIKFDLGGISIGSGSACSSGKVAPSHVLAAMGADSIISRSALRVSFGQQSRKADAQAALNIWNEIVQSNVGLREMSAA